MPSKTDTPPSIRCSFCLKLAPEVESLISGPGIYICNECVHACVEILDEKPASEAPKQRLPRWQSMSDAELLGVLPRIAAVATQVEGNLQRWVAEAHRRGTSWAQIGSALNMTRQSAWERFARGESDD